MWIDKKRRVEIEQRQGLSGRVLIVVGVLLSVVVVAYFITGWLFSSGTLTSEFFYNQLAVPQTVSQTVIRIGLMLVLVVSAQFLAILVLAVMNPENRKKSGRATAVAQSTDFYDSQVNGY